MWGEYTQKARLVLWDGITPTYVGRIIRDSVKLEAL